MPHAGLEIEIKLRVADAAAARRLLRRLGAQPLGRVHEWNTLFDTPENALGRSGRLLRVRHLKKMGSSGARAGSRGHGKPHPSSGVLTFKAPAEGGPYKARLEVEAAIDPPTRAESILESLGFRPWFRYEKFRTTFRLPGLPRLAVELDETPIGVFFELEGPRNSIDRAAKCLGYAPGDYLTASYYELFQSERDRLGLAANAMLFPSKK